MRAPEEEVQDTVYKLLKAGIVPVPPDVCRQPLWPEKPDHLFKVWLCILWLCEWKQKGDKIEGTAFVYFPEINKMLPGLSESQWHRALQWFRKNGMFESMKAPRGLYIGITKMW